MMLSWGCASRDGVCANASFSHVKPKNKVQEIIDVYSRTPAGCVGWQFLIPQSWRAYRRATFRRRQGGAPLRVARSWDRGGAAAPQRGG